MDRTCLRAAFGRALVTSILVLCPVIVAAQTVIDPRTAEFDPSAEHNAVASDGTPLVQEYLLSVYVLGVSTPFESVTLGKPTPDPDGKIRIDLLARLSPLPPQDVIYVARITVRGPSGSAESTPSNEFTFTAPCSFAISPTSGTLTAGGGVASVAVTAPNGCGWTTTSNAAWVAITTGASGSGNGSVTFTVTENTSSSPRSGTLTIAGQTFTLTQAAAASCAYTISPAAQSVAASGGTGSISVTAAEACNWTASSNASWLTIASGGTGAGAGVVGFNAAANTSTSSRTGVITIGGQLFTVTQAAAACAYTAAPTAISLASSSVTGTVAISTTTSCAWTAKSSAAWLTILAGASGTGNGSVSFNAASNGSTGARTGTMTAAGQTITVTQAGTACAYTLSPTSRGVNNKQNTGTISVTAGAGCAWRATTDAPWITVSGSGVGSGSVSYTVAENSAATSRTGKILIGTSTFTITQKNMPGAPGHLRIVTGAN